MCPSRCPPACPHTTSPHRKPSQLLASLHYCRSVKMLSALRLRKQNAPSVRATMADFAHARELMQGARSSGHALHRSASVRNCALQLQKGCLLGLTRCREILGSARWYPGRGRGHAHALLMPGLHLGLFASTLGLWTALRPYQAFACMCLLVRPSDGGVVDAQGGGAEFANHLRRMLFVAKRFGSQTSMWLGFRHALCGPSFPWVAICRRGRVVLEIPFAALANSQTVDLLGLLGGDTMLGVWLGIAWQGLNEGYPRLVCSAEFLHLSVSGLRELFCPTVSCWCPWHLGVWRKALGKAPVVWERASPQWYRHAIHLAFVPTTVERRCFGGRRGDRCLLGSPLGPWGSPPCF